MVSPREYTFFAFTVTSRNSIVFASVSILHSPERLGIFMTTDFISIRDTRSIRLSQSQRTVI